MTLHGSQHLVERQEINKERIDQNRREAPDIAVGAYVYLRLDQERKQKLERFGQALFQVLERKELRVRLLGESGEERWAHVSDVTLVRAPPADRPVFDPYQRARLLLHRELTKEELAVEERYNAKLTAEKHVTFDLPEEPEQAATAPEIAPQAKDRDPFRMEVLDLLGSIRALVPERPNDSTPVEPASSASVVLPPKEKEELIEDPPLPARVQTSRRAPSTRLRRQISPD